MKRFILCIPLALALFLGSSFAGPPKIYDLSNDNLTGFVASVEEISFDWDGERWKKAGHDTLSYNEQGFRIRREERSPWSISDTTYSYNKQGLLTETISRELPDGEVFLHFEYEYDSAGRWLATRKFTLTAGEKSSHPSFVSDHTELRGELSTERYSVYTLDEEGRVTHREWHDPDFPLPPKTFSYNEQGQLTKELFLAPEGNPIRIRTFQYDSGGRLEKEVTEKLVRDTWFIDDYTVYTYDEHGNPVVISEFGMDDELLEETTYTYTYDKYGNWIAREHFWLNKFSDEARPMEKMIREITYY